MVNITEIIIVVINAIVAPLIIWGVMEGAKFLKEKSKNDKVDSLIDRISEIVVDAVGETKQTLVDGIKGTTEWTDEAKKRVFEQTLNTVKTSIGEPSLELLKDIIGDINVYLTSKIESCVGAMK